MSRLWYKQKAACWEEALPLGNGRIGAMIFGDVVNEQIQVNEDSVWYGGKVDRSNPDTLTYLPEIRKLILDGQIRKAERLMRFAMSGCPDSMHPYQSLGDIYFTFENVGNVTTYERSLDLETGVYTQHFQADGVSYVREIFISEPAQVMCMKFSADVPGMIHFYAILRRERFFDGVKKVGANGICLYGNLGKGGLDFAMQLSAFSKGGSVKVIGEHLIVEDADEVCLYFGAGTTFRMDNVEAVLKQQINTAAKRGFQELRQEHIADYQNLYKRVAFELEDIANYEEIPTDVRLQKATEGNVDIGLSKLYFDYGRYLLIASSRPGTLPATLQGLWNRQMLPPWDSKFTININTEMNYWPAESCNLSECHLPLFDLIEHMVENGQQTAKKMYGCRGFVAHHNTDIWGDTVTQDIWIPGSYWVMGAAWLCTHQWTHYQYTKDEIFLRRAYPIMRECALFFLDFLIEDKGYLKTCPSVSPENTFILPNGEKGANSAGVTMDNQILRDLFNQCIDSAAILEIEDELTSEFIHARDRLMPTQIGKNGTIMEWAEDYEEWEQGHRHISHLYGLHPSEQITIDKTPELAKAAHVTLERRLANGGGHTGWSRAWIINHYAKLWDGETAYFHLEKLFEKSTLPNLFDNHPPFQIDGNFGATAAIAEMLVQSTLERIVLLPALPSAWKKGSIKGLCIKGGAEIDLTWEHGTLLSCQIRATKMLHTKVRYGNEIRDLQLEPGRMWNW